MGGYEKQGHGGAGAALVIKAPTLCLLAERLEHVASVTVEACSKADYVRFRIEGSPQFAVDLPSASLPQEPHMALAPRMHAALDALEQRMLHIIHALDGLADSVGG